MTERTIIGKRYVVESAAGCVVTSGRGRVLCDVAPGMEGKFVATDGRVVCSDPLAVVREAQELEALPAGSWFFAELYRELMGLLDGSTFRLWWREGLNKLFIMTQLTTDDLNEQVLAVAAKYVPDGVTAEVFNLNKYAHCVNLDDMIAVNPDYQNDLTSEGEWVYLLPVFNARRLFAHATNLKKLDMEMPALTDMIYFTSWSGVKEAKVVVNNVTKCSFWISEQLEVAEFAGEKITHFEFTTCPKLRIARFDSSKITIANGGFSHTRVLEECPMKYPALSTAQNMFPLTQFNLEQTSELLGSLPTWNDGELHEITLGIHVDYQNDAEMLAVIENTEAKGWTLTIKWNGTPTAQSASTFGLRKPPIYAKLGTVERPDGTIEEYLDWGHYVTEWESNGYQEFAFIEEAKEYFNITE